MLKRFLIAAILAPLLALAQSYPSPTFNNLTVNGTSSLAGAISGAGITALFASPPAIGGTAPGSGAFTTLSASGAVSGAGFTNYLAAPPAIGGTTPNAGSFSTLSATGTVSGAGITARFSTPGPIGNTTPSTGAFTTITATSTITPSSTNGIVGTTTNDNVNAGSVGEYVSATNSGGTSLTSNTGTNITSISLTAGDWDVSGIVFFNTSANNLNNMLVNVGSVSAALGGLGTQNQSTSAGAAIGTGYLGTPLVRFSLSTTTTVYLVGYAGFASGTVTATGIIRARRVR